MAGNMYPWVDETRNPLAGECLHSCSYCYMKKYPFNRIEKYKGTPRIDEGELKKIRGQGKVIFVCSANDLFGSWVPPELISKILMHCDKFDNTYLFQSKNPEHFLKGFTFPKKTILGTTIESNRSYYYVSKAPQPGIRKDAMIRLGGMHKMVSIEPVLDFDLQIFVSWIKAIQPEFVSIGADSKGNNLPEPAPEKLRSLIQELGRFTEVKCKENLGRLTAVNNQNKGA